MELVNGPSGDWPDDMDERCAIEVATAAGSAALVDFVIRPEAVEIWFRRRRRAILDRHALRCWLAEPHRSLTVGEVVLSSQRMLDLFEEEAPDRPDLLVWNLSPTALADLRYRI